MKVLLTGASGFVGGHILERLLADGIPTAVLLRPSSPHPLQASTLGRIEIIHGCLEDQASLCRALDGITHVIHGAGLTRARHNAEFFQVNHLGTKRLVESVNGRGRQIQRFLHLSSLAACGPGSSSNPARESSPPQPVSVYGRSKLAGEQEVVLGCHIPFTVLRPPGVYGPRDAEFLKLFRAVRLHLRPEFGGGSQELSLVFAPDLATVVVQCLTQAPAANRVYHVASSEVVTAAQLARCIAAAMNVWTVPLPLPTASLWPVCLARQFASCLGASASVLSLQKYPELAAPGWVCDVTRLQDDLGLSCPTRLREGIAATLDSYRRAGWLRG